MYEIFTSLAARDGYALTPLSEEALRQLFVRLYAGRDERFGNGRTVRNVFDEAVNRQAMRLSTCGQVVTVEDLQLLLSEDVPPSMG
jgi:stage V sporulation protein K